MNTPADPRPRNSKDIIVATCALLTIAVAAFMGWWSAAPQAALRVSQWERSLRRAVVMPFHARGGLPLPPADHESLPTVSTLDLDRG